ncbi:MAG: hypothetical protein OIF58_03725 [Cohaesibacter sp.]|nr:hypothetical protein [Cohaesibacter sp.]
MAEIWVPNADLFWESFSIFAFLDKISLEIVYEPDKLSLSANETLFCEAVDF